VSCDLLFASLVVGSFDELPFSNRAPARTSGTRWGAMTARQRCCADSMSLNAMATPAAREPGPLVMRCRGRTVAKVDSIGLVAGSPSARRGSCRTPGARRGRR